MIGITQDLSVGIIEATRPGGPALCVHARVLLDPFSLLVQPSRAVSHRDDRLQRRGLALEVGRE